MHSSRLLKPKATRPLLSLTTLAILAASPALQANNDELQLLKQQLEVLQQRIEQLEQREVPAAESPIARVAEEEATVNVETLSSSREKGSFRIPGTSTSVKVGGYVKLDARYSTNGVTGTGGGLTLLRQDVATQSNDDRDGRAELSARESRFYIKTTTDLDNGKKVGTYIEGDFFGAGGNEFVSNSFGFRLRQAYATYDRWLFGQSWTTFMDLNHLGELNDFGQHASTIFARQAQIRYTYPLESGSLMFAVENGESLGGTSSDDESTPDFVARWNHKGDWGSASISGLARTLTLDNGTTDDTKVAGAVSLTGKFKTVGKDDLRLQYNYGALGRYMGFALFNDTRVDANNEVDKIDSWGASAAYRHWWTDKSRSTLMYSYAEADDPANLEDAWTLHANYMYDLTKTVRVGLELARKEVTLNGGATRDVTNIHFATRVVF